MPPVMMPRPHLPEGWATFFELIPPRDEDDPFWLIVDRFTGGVWRDAGEWNALDDVRWLVGHGHAILGQSLTLPRADLGDEEAQARHGAEWREGASPAPGEKLRQRREALGWTQAQLAKELGVAPNTIYRWEKGTVRIENPSILGHALSHIEWREHRRRRALEQFEEEERRLTEQKAAEQAASTR